MYRPSSSGAARIGPVVLGAILAISTGCTPTGKPSSGSSDSRPSPTHDSSTFTTAHATIADAVSDFFGVRPSAKQPIDFPHDVHVSNGLTCTEFCHEGAPAGPVAGLPSLNTCMICHASIAIDRPIIQQISALHGKGVDLSWQRVYGYTAGAHVRFDHAPHIRANVECATCHGPVAQQRVAERNIDLNMGFCVTCHAERKASNDCLTCHF